MAEAETDGSDKRKSEIKGPGVFMCKVCVSTNQEELRIELALPRHFVFHSEMWDATVKT